MATARISSREYKILLLPDQFRGGEVAMANAAAAFWRSFQRAIDGVALDSNAHLAVGKSRLIRFYDTSDRRLYRNDYIFRERIDATSGRREVTLKFRHPDRYVAASRDLSPASSRNAKTKFEEDIKAPFQGLYSHSTTQAIGRKKDLNHLNDPGRLFPGLAEQLDRYDRDKSITAVGGLTMREVVLTGAGLRIGKSPKVEATCALIVWYDVRGDADRPEVVEFSFRYGDAHEAYGGGAARRAYQIFRILQEPALSNWVDSKGTTKTAWVYSHASAASDAPRPPAGARSYRDRPAPRLEHEHRI